MASRGAKFWLVRNIATFLPKSFAYLPMISSTSPGKEENDLIWGKMSPKNIPSVSPESVHGVRRLEAGMQGVWRHFRSFFCGLYSKSFVSSMFQTNEADQLYAKLISTSPSEDSCKGWLKKQIRTFRMFRNQCLSLVLQTQMSKKHSIQKFSRCTPCYRDGNGARYSKLC